MEERKTGEEGEREREGERVTGCKARNSRKRTIASTMEKKTATATHKTYCTVSPTCFQRWVGDNKTKERKRERDGVMRFERLFSSVLILSSPPSAHERGNHIACKWIKRLCRGKKEQNEAEARAACARGRKRRQKANVTKHKDGLFVPSSLRRVPGSW